MTPNGTTIKWDIRTENTPSKWAAYKLENHPTSSRAFEFSVRCLKEWITTPKTKMKSKEAVVTRGQDEEPKMYGKREVVVRRRMTAEKELFQGSTYLPLADFQLWGFSLTGERMKCLQCGSQEHCMWRLFLVIVIPVCNDTKCYAQPGSWVTKINRVWKFRTTFANLKKFKNWEKR